MTIQIEYEAEREWEIDYRPIIEEIVVAALDYEKCPYEAEVNVVLTNDEEIHRINKEFRGIDRATDVLSFPMGDYDVPILNGWKSSQRTILTRRRANFFWAIS